MASESKGNRCIEVGLGAVVPLWQGGVRAQQRVVLTGLIGAQHATVACGLRSPQQVRDTQGRLYS